MPSREAEGDHVFLAVAAALAQVPDSLSQPSEELFLGTPNEGNREERLAVGTPAPGGPAEAGTCTRLSPGEDLPAKKRSRVAQKPLRAFPKAVTVGSPLFRLRR